MKDIIKTFSGKAALSNNLTLYSEMFIVVLLFIKIIRVIYFL